MIKKENTRDKSKECFYLTC